jgi:hypothetical protein
VGSWLYRIEYTAWDVLTHGIGEGKAFDGPFDALMDFAFYLPNLAVAELFIRARKISGNTFVRMVTVVLLGGGSVFVAVMTYYMLMSSWGAEIKGLFAGS